MALYYMVRLRTSICWICLWTGPATDVLAIQIAAAWHLHLALQHHLPLHQPRSMKGIYSDDYLLVITDYNWDYTFYKWGYK